MTRTVPPERFAAELPKFYREVIMVLEAGVKFRALEAAFEFAVRKAPKDTVKATFGLNPTWGRPEALMHGDRPAFPIPGAERTEPLRRTVRFGESGFLTFHALDSKGVYDYAGNDAGRSLENGWSAQARDGVIGPTRRHIESNVGRITAEGVRDAVRELGG